jgi:NAD(P)-dependent dehydrogenase (short-subunit alcohol dehydrogenase family)
MAIPYLVNRDAHPGYVRREPGGADVTRIWTAADVPDQTGRTAVVTGANTGLGYETALVLAARGATTVLACRDVGKGERAADRIRTAHPAARLAVTELDLGSLESVRAAAARLGDEHPRIDLLINNAGLMGPRETHTADGFEIHLGVNHLGHFALTGLLLDRLLTTPGSRVVTVSSIGHRRGRLHRDDLQLTGERSRNAAYFQSKLANLLFSYELGRRLTAAGAGTLAVAAHPGNSNTDLIRNFPPPARLLMHPRLRFLHSWLVQQPPIAALGTLRAAVDPDAPNGGYYGPPGRAQFTGHPQKVDSSPASHDEDDARWLWAESERLTGVTYRIEPARSC